MTDKTEPRPGDNEATREQLAELRTLLKQQDTESRRLGPDKKKSIRKTRAKRRLKRIRAGIRKGWRRVRRFRKKQADAVTPVRKGIEWFQDHDGFCERPAGSNCGPHKITESQHYLGYTWACQNGGEGVFWCGCTAGFVLKHVCGAKIPNINRIGFNEHIESDAANHSNGLRKIDPRNGSALCIATMKYPHIVTWLSEPDSNGYVTTGEGNTSSSANGSQNNGGEYAIKRHHISEFDTVAEVAGIHFDK